jgi:hypothetical protein
VTAGALAHERLFDRFAERAGLASGAGLREVVEALRQIPYARPKLRTPEGVVAEWRGTCSSKHALLAALAAHRFPDADVRLRHRVYHLTPDSARRLFGDEAARRVPQDGLTDVHTYATAIAGGGRITRGRRVQIDVTFPGDAWDGRSDMALSCGEGIDDTDAGLDAVLSKQELVERHCEPRLREQFIAALTRRTAR